MPQELRRRPQRTINYASNQKIPEDMSRGMVYREIMLRLKGQLTVAMANNTAAKTKKGDEWAVVKRIELIANNTDVIKSISGNTLWWLNYFMYGARPRITGDIANSAVDNPAFDSVLILPLWMPNAVRPMDTALDARRLSDLKMEITWGTHTDINGDATGFTVSPYIQVHTMESFNVQGTFAQWRVYTIEKEITATNPNFQIQLPVGNAFRGFIINTDDAGADDGAVLNNFKWKSGTNVFADVPGTVLQQAYSLRSGLQREFATTDFAALRRGSANDIDGWYIYDHVTDGLLTETVDTLGFSEHTLDLDVTIGGGTTKIFVTPIEIVPVRTEQNAGQRR